MRHSVGTNQENQSRTGAADNDLMVRLRSVTEFVNIMKSRAFCSDSYEKRSQTIDALFGCLKRAEDAQCFEVVISAYQALLRYQGMDDVVADYPILSNRKEILERAHRYARQGLEIKGAGFWVECFRQLFKQFPCVTYREEFITLAFSLSAFAIQSKNQLVWREAESIWQQVVSRDQNLKDLSQQRSMVAVSQLRFCQSHVIFKQEAISNDQQAVTEKKPGERYIHYPYSFQYSKAMMKPRVTNNAPPALAVFSQASN